GRRALPVRAEVVHPFIEKVLFPGGCLRHFAVVVDVRDGVDVLVPEVSRRGPAVELVAVDLHAVEQLRAVGIVTGVRVLGAANLARARRARDGIRADEAAGEERPSRRADAHLGADAIRIVDTGIGSTARLRARADLAAIRIRVAAAEAHDAVAGETVVGDGAAHAR